MGLKPGRGGVDLDEFVVDFFRFERTEADSKITRKLIDTPYQGAQTGFWGKVFAISAHADAGEDHFLEAGITKMLDGLRTSAGGRLRLFPRTDGMMQYEQFASHPLDLDVGPGSGSLDSIGKSG